METPLKTRKYVQPFTRFVAIFFVGIEVIINITNISFKETPLRFVSGFYTFIRCH